MNETTSGPDLFNLLADEFAERYRNGARPPLSESTEKYPDLAEQIRELFPALVAMEQLDSGADQESLGRHVALKVMPQHRMTDPRQLERFRREARAAAMLHHTNIVPVFGVGECDGVHYYAMQFIQGQSLDAVLGEVKRLRQLACPTPASRNGKDAELASSVAMGMLSGQFAQEAIAPQVETTVQELSSDASTSSMLSHSGSPYYQGVARIGLQAAEALAYAHHVVLEKDFQEWLPLR